MPAPERLRGVDRDAALRATVLSLLVVASVVATGVAAASAATSGDQPATRVEQVPVRPSAPAWEEASARTVTLSKQQMAPPYGGGSVDQMEVRTLTNDTHVAFRLAWRDPTRDTSLGSPRNYSDAVAVMARDGSMPPITMGAAGKPVNIWYWRASWQFGGPNGEGTGDMYAYPHPDAETKPGRAAGNPLSKASYDRYAQNIYAKGFGSVSDAPTQNVRAHGTRTEEGWAVTFVRERSTNGTYDAAFGSSKPTYLAFAVWNGSADEANGQKSITLQFSKFSADGELVAASGGGNSEPTATAEGTGGGQSLLARLAPYAALFLIVFWLVTYWGVKRR